MLLCGATTLTLPSCPAQYTRNRPAAASHTPTCWSPDAVYNTESFCGAGHSRQHRKGVGSNNTISQGGRTWKEIMSISCISTSVCNADSIHPKGAHATVATGLWGTLVGTYACTPPTLPPLPRPCRRWCCCGQATWREGGWPCLCTGCMAGCLLRCPQATHSPPHHPLSAAGSLAQPGRGREGGVAGQAQPHGFGEGHACPRDRQVGSRWCGGHHQVEGPPVDCASTNDCCRCCGSCAHVRASIRCSICVCDSGGWWRASVPAFSLLLPPATPVSSIKLPALLTRLIGPQPTAAIICWPPTTLPPRPPGCR